MDAVVDERAVFETEALEARGVDAGAGRRASAVRAGLRAVAAEEAVREGDDRRRRRARDACSLAGELRRPTHAVRDEVAVRDEHVAGAGLADCLQQRLPKEEALDRDGVPRGAAELEEGGDITIGLKDEYEKVETEEKTGKLVFIKSVTGGISIPGLC